jgi:hypothetical protein
MTTHETVNRRYSDLQAQLRALFNAEGRGLVEMVRSVENQMSTTLSWELRAIAHIRNKVVHEGLAEIPRYFEPLCKEAVTSLKQIKADRKAAAKAQRTVSKPAKPAKPKATLVLKPKAVKATGKKAAVKPATKKATARRHRASA